MVLFWLICGHFLCDYPLQGDYMAAAKDRHAGKFKEWFWALSGHSFIHGGAVLFATGLWWLACLEIVSHFVIDDLKCAGRISYNIDQVLHIVFKFIWFSLFLNFGFGGGM